MSNDTRETLRRSIPNALSFSRIPLSVFLLLVKPFSSWFVAIYIACGLTDALDGYCARRFHVESRFGARIDSIADFAFFSAALYTFLTALLIPPILIVWALAVILIRLVGLGAASRKFHTWPALHTDAFKVLGFVFFCFPLFFQMFGALVAGGGLCLIATFATGEELYINHRAESLNPDIHSARQLPKAWGNAD